MKHSSFQQHLLLLQLFPIDIFFSRNLPSSLDINNIYFQSYSIFFLNTKRKQVQHLFTFLAIYTLLLLPCLKTLLLNVSMCLKVNIGMKYIFKRTVQVLNWNKTQKLAEATGASLVFVRICRYLCKKVILRATSWKTNSIHLCNTQITKWSQSHWKNSKLLEFVGLDYFYTCTSTHESIYRVIPTVSVDLDVKSPIRSRVNAVDFMPLQIAHNLPLKEFYNRQSL